MASLWVLRSLGFIAIAYTIALTIGSLAEPVEIKTSVSNIDKLLHLGAYVGLALLWLSFYHLLKRNTTQLWMSIKSYVFIACILIVYGIIIEILQGATTDYRTPDIWDVLANTIGVCLGSIFFVLFFKNFMRLKTRN